MSITIKTDIVFPCRIGARLTRELIRRKDNVETRSGNSFPSTNWSRSKRRFSVSYGFHDFVNAAKDFENFIEALEGGIYGFLYEDHGDYSSNGFFGAPTKDDQNIGTGDAVTVAFQLRKAYTYGSTTHYRKITRPQSGTVLVAVDGSLQTESVDYTVDYTTGIVTFLSAPSGSPAPSITAGFKFYTPCEIPQESFVMEEFLRTYATWRRFPFQEVFE